MPESMKRKLQCFLGLETLLCGAAAVVSDAQHDAIAGDRP